MAKSKNVQRGDYPVQVKLDKDNWHDLNRIVTHLKHLGPIPYRRPLSAAIRYALWFCARQLDGNNMRQLDHER